MTSPHVLREPIEHPQFPPGVEESAQFLSSRISVSPEIAVVLGSGLGGFAEKLNPTLIVPAAEIPRYPPFTVTGHSGKLIFATCTSKQLLVFQGRIHFYECNDYAMVVHPVAVAAALGCRTLVVTNAAGGIHRSFQPGDLIIIRDHIDLTLEGMGSETRRSTPRTVYDPLLASRAAEVARKMGIRLRSGVYACVKGPSYETAAEVEMIRRVGGDAVGMSTAKEAVYAAQCGLRVLGISCITNKAAGIGTSKLDHAEVTEVGRRVHEAFSTFLLALVESL
jgi:purine-nucleoside phosphorylase